MTFTDNAEADIETHREIAKWNRIGGIGFLLGGLGYASLFADNPELAAVTAVGIAAVCYGAANSMSIQALRWEIEEADQ